MLHHQTVTHCLFSENLANFISIRVFTYQLLSRQLYHLQQILGELDRWIKERYSESSQFYDGNNNKRGSNQGLNRVLLLEMQEKMINMIIDFANHLPYLPNRINELNYNKLRYYNLMDFLGLTLQESLPRARRHTTSGLSSFFKSAMGGAFLSFFEDTLAHKPTLEQNEQQIKSNFKTINSIIDTVDRHIVKRLQIHEEEVFAIVKEQVQEMRKETQRIISQLNHKIMEKNVNNEMWHLNNELDYFKNITFRLFEENKRYRLQIKLLENNLRNFKIENECLDATMQRIRKKYLRSQSLQAKTNRGKEADASPVKRSLKEPHLLKKQLSANSNQKVPQPSAPEVRGFGLSSLSKELKANTNREESSNAERSSLNPGLFSRGKQSPVIVALDQNQSRQRMLDQLSIPSMSLHSSDFNAYALPPVRLVQVESHNIDNDSGSMAERSMSSQIQSSILPRKEDKATQTEETYIRIKPSYKFSSGYISQLAHQSSSLHRTQRCNTEKNVQLLNISIKQQDKRQAQMGTVRQKQESVRPQQRQVFRVSGQPKKQSKSIMYMSNALTKSKLKTEHFMTTRQKYSSYA